MPAERPFSPPCEPERLPIWATLLGLALLAAYALPLHAPPEAAPIPMVLWDTPMLARLFPGVPDWWVLGRLACLVVGAFLLAGGAAAATGRFALQPPGDDTSEGIPPAGNGGADAERRVTNALLVAGSGLLLAAPWAFRFSRPGQLLFLGLLVGIPAVAVARRSLRERRARSGNGTLHWAAPLAIATAWTAQRLAVSTRSVRVADGLDYLDGYLCHQSAADPGFNLLTDACWAGYSALPAALHGQGILGWGGIPLTLPLVQILAILAAAIAALLLGNEVSRRVGPGPAIVATAAFLWSPLVLVRPLVPSPAVLTTVTAVLLVLASRLQRRPDAAGAAAFGVAVGIGTHLPFLYAIVPLFAALGVQCLRSQRRLALVAMLFLAAAAIPGASNHLGIVRTAGHLASTTTPWWGLEGVYSGRIAPSLSEGSRTSGVPRHLDVAAGLAVAPFAVARAPQRHWADVVIEPLGAALAAVGLAAALLAARHGPGARFLVAFLLAAMLPGLASSYDRVHATRIDIPIPMALLTAFGWHLLSQRSVLGRRPVAAACIAVVLIAASGTHLFDVVNPRLLPNSAPGLALRAGAAWGHEVLWADGVLAMGESYGPILGNELGDGQPRSWSARRGAATVQEWPDRPALFWTPGEQMDTRASRELCEVAPEFAFHEVRDRTGLTRLFVAVRPDAPPRAPTPGVEWIELACEVPFETDAVVASRAIENAQAQATAGSIGAAIATLEEAARRTLAQPRLYFPLANLLAARGEAGDLEGAMFWADLSCRVTAASYIDACTLAMSLRQRNAPGH